MIARPTNVMDPNFSTQLALWNNQRNQDAANQKTHDEWLVTAANWISANQQNQNLGLPLTPVPALPTMTIYDDDGKIEHPLFPDLRVPTLSPAIQPSPSTSIVSAPTADRTDSLLIMVQMMSEDVAAIKAKLGA